VFGIVSRLTVPTVWSSVMKRMMFGRLDPPPRPGEQAPPARASRTTTSAVASLGRVGMGVF
jgi:hypothetical protein